MPLERKPVNIVLRDHPPPHTKPYKVADGDNWWNIARRYDVDPWDIIEINFKTKRASEVNWYLRHYVGCKKVTADRKNWIFSSDADPGIIHVPVREILMPPMIVKGEDPAPSYLRKVWAGIGFGRSADAGIAGKHEVEGKIYCLGDEIPDVKNAYVRYRGDKLGLGLGFSYGKFLIFAHGYEDPSEFQGPLGSGDFDVSLGVKLDGLVKGLKGIGSALKTVNEYKKVKYVAENVAKNINIVQPGFSSFPIPLAGIGLHASVGYKFGDIIVWNKGIGVP